MSKRVKITGPITKVESIPSNVKDPETTAKTKKSRGRASTERRKLRRAQERAEKAQTTSDPNDIAPLVDLRLVIEGRRREASERSGEVKSVEFSCSLKASTSSADPREKPGSSSRSSQGCQEHPLPEPSSSRRSSTVSFDSGIDKHTSLRPSTFRSYSDVPDARWKDDDSVVTKRVREKFVLNRCASEDSSGQPSASNPGRTFKWSDERDHSPVDRSANVCTFYNRMTQQKHSSQSSPKFNRSPLKNTDGSVLTALDVPSPVRQRRE